MNLDIKINIGYMKYLKIRFIEIDRLENIDSENLVKQLL